MTFSASWTREGPPPLPVGTRLRLVDFPSHRIWINDTGQPTFVGNLAADERVDERLRATFERTGIRSVAFMPLTLSGRWIGITIISFQAPHTFTVNEQQLYRSIAAQATVAIENRRLLEQTQAALAELEATQRAYLREQWEGYLGAASQALGFVESPAGLRADNTLWLPEMDQAIQRGETVTLAVAGDGGASRDARSALALPIRLRGESIGVLEFYDQDPSRAWSEDERALAQTLADQAALALENARLFEDTQSRAQREQMINAITARIRASTDMEAILRTTTEELARTLNLSSARIRLNAGDGPER
jgi:GAF domain-containing protein